MNSASKRRTPAEIEQLKKEAIQKLARKKLQETSAVPAPPQILSPPDVPPKQTGKKKQTIQVFGDKSRDTMGRRVSIGAAKGAYVSDEKAPNQFFKVELCLADEPAPNGSTEPCDRLIVQAKSFPGYPAADVLRWITSGNSPAGKVGKFLLEKGQVATWKVTPTTTYHALVAKAKGEPLLSVEDEVERRITDAKDWVETAESALHRAEEECTSLGVEVLADVAALVRSANTIEEAAGTARFKSKNTKAKNVLGSANRGKKKTGRVVGRGVSQEIEPTPLPHFDRPAWESADTGTRGAEKNNSSQVPRLNGFDEKELAAVLLSAVAQMPRPKVSPATACANDLIKKLQYAQKHHLLDLGVPVSGDGNSSTDALLSLDPLVLRAVRRCGIPVDFSQRTAVLAKATGGTPVPQKMHDCGYQPGQGSNNQGSFSGTGHRLSGDDGVSMVDVLKSRASSTSQVRTNNTPPETSEAIDLVSNDEDDDDVVVIDYDGVDGTRKTPADTQNTPAESTQMQSDLNQPKKPAPFFASPAALASTLKELRSSAEDLIRARAELDSVTRATRTAVKRKRGGSSVHGENMVFGGERGGTGGVDFATGAGAGWEGQGSGSMGFDVRGW